MKRFELVSEYEPKGDQPQAIDALVKNLKDGVKDQVLLGVTGSGKTFTMANVIAHVNRPALVISHNKTLAAQLFAEFKTFFPHNAVEYFISYYDYYQPEAYLPQTDTYIEKDSDINEEIERMRHSATRSVLERRDVIIVASVSCIYGLGSPEWYKEMGVFVKRGEERGRDYVIQRLVEMQYLRNDLEFKRGVFCVKGDTLEVFPAYDNFALRIEFFGDEVDLIERIDPLTKRAFEDMETVFIYPNSHYVVPEERLKRALGDIEKELDERVSELISQKKIVEAQRLKQRTLYDIEMIKEIGYCKGIENYSRHLDGRPPGSHPATLLDYLPSDTIIFIDESHVTIPQLKGMYRGDRSRKETLVNYGFRLPSALDNRPLKYEEFELKRGQVIYVSATPAPLELSLAGRYVAEQIIRPTGLVDPKVLVRKASSQVDDLYGEILKRVENKERVLITTLTKRMAEDLAEYYNDLGVKVRYLHSEINALERVDIIRDLRMGEFDVLIGVNLLREGLDIPEVSLVAVLDADKEGFLRSEISLIQTCGRAARNVNGTVIMYADEITKSMQRAIAEMNRRRRKQLAYNKRYNITPESIKKSIRNVISSVYEADYYTVSVREDREFYGSVEEIRKVIEELEKKMREAARKWEFETAAVYRDRIKSLTKEHSL